jgi:hypothetical protein
LDFQSFNEDAIPEGSVPTTEEDYA